MGGIERTQISKVQPKEDVQERKRNSIVFRQQTRDREGVPSARMISGNGAKAGREW